METGKGQGLKIQQPLSTLAEAYQLHQDLQNTINQMDSKIQEVIKSHEAEFLLAYRTHIQKIKQELSDIKQRGEEQQKKMLSNERSVFLEKQIILFREEALRLYQRVQQITDQNDLLKVQSRELKKAHGIMQKENREQAKQLKILQTEKSMLQAEIDRLQEQLQQLHQDVQQDLNKPKAKLRQGQTTKSNLYQHSKVYTTPKPKQSFNFPLPLRSRKVSFTAEISSKKGSLRGKHSEAESGGSAEVLMDHELKLWFVSCLQRIRRQVGHRRVNGSRGEQILKVASWEQFRMIDKLRLLEMFMQNEKLLVWMYQKIFPSRINQIQEYLAQRQGAVPQKSKSTNIQMAQLQLPLEQFIPPEEAQQPFFPHVDKFEKKTGKTKKYIMAGRGEVRNGKLLLAKKDLEHD